MKYCLLLVLLGMLASCSKETGSNSKDSQSFNALNSDKEVLNVVTTELADTSYALNEGDLSELLNEEVITEDEKEELQALIKKQ
jgi:uncharacterized protein YcfL